MDEPTLSKADHEIMTSRGWDPENPVLAAKYIDLRERVDRKGITEEDLTREMRKQDNQQVVRQEEKNWDLYLTNPEYQKKVDVQSKQREAREQEELQKKQGDHVL